MRGYAVIRRDGTFVEGRIPDGIDLEKFCIMCAAAFGAGNASQMEVDSGASKVIVRGVEESIVITRYGEKELLIVIGTEEEAEDFLKRK